MDKGKLLNLIKGESDIEAIGMILSNYADYGHGELGGMVSLKQFNIVAEVLLEWWSSKNVIIVSLLAKISPNIYEQRRMPRLYAQRDFTHRSVLYQKGDEFSTYHSNYSNVVSLIKNGDISNER